LQKDGYQLSSGHVYNVTPERPSRKGNALEGKLSTPGQGRRTKTKIKREHFAQGAKSIFSASIYGKRIREKMFKVPWKTEGRNRDVRWHK